MTVPLQEGLLGKPPPCMGKNGEKKPFCDKPDSLQRIQCFLSNKKKNMTILLKNVFFSVRCPFLKHSEEGSTEQVEKRSDKHPSEILTSRSNSEESPEQRAMRITTQRQVDVVKYL